MSLTFQSATRSKGRARLDCIMTKQANRRLVRCVEFHRPSLDAPESYHNLVYAKVRTSRRSAPNRRKRDSTKQTLKTADLRRLMTYTNLRCQVTNAMTVVLPPIPDGTRIGDIATIWLTSCFPLRLNWHRAQSARAEHRVGARVLAWKLKMAGKNLRKVRKAAVLSFFWAFVRKLETRVREGDQAVLFKHLRTMDLEGKRDRSSPYIKDKDGILPGDVKLIRERWVEWFHTVWIYLLKCRWITGIV